MVEQLDGWLRLVNLKGFLVALSEIVGYRFGELDWGAVETGLEVGPDDDEWFTYPLVGRTTVEIAVSRAEEEGDIDVRVQFPADSPCLGKQIEVAWMIFNRFEISPTFEMID
ncbi:hypothetical protein BL253_28740 [Pseudofrankia asymbiotica]|uniref:Uncharacterized protein n=1 Tax=Pseudofrankia asymbiotica TaxID=1834516 RepID=A0A1V2I4J1_9ACTN|nr:hypothetical protein BL253_28740 [Pseudofrankia asymbiotica]